MAWYRTLGPVTYTDGDQVRHITKAGIRIDLTPTQAAELAGMIVLDRTTPFTYPRADFLKYESAVLFPTEGIEDAVYLANDSGLLYRWINDDYAPVGVVAAWGEITGAPAVIAAGSTEADAQTALGGTATGRAVFTADDAAAGREALGLDRSASIGDGTTDARAEIAARDAAAITAGVPLRFPKGTYRIASTITIASPVIMDPGAILKPDNAITVTMTGGMDAPIRQVFDVSVGGKVRVKNPKVYPDWWGAAGDGTTDDATALRMVFNDNIVAFGGGTIDLPFGKVYASSLPIDMKSNTRVVGSGGLKCLAFHSAGMFVQYKNAVKNVTWDGPFVDINYFENMNGHAVGDVPNTTDFVSDIYIRGKVMRTRIDKALEAVNTYFGNETVLYAGGGKGLTIQFRARNVYANILTEDCDIAASIEAAVSDTRHLENVVIDVQAKDSARCALFIGGSREGVSSLDSGSFVHAKYPGIKARVHAWGGQTGLIPDPVTKLIDDPNYFNAGVVTLNYASGVSVELTAATQSRCTLIRGMASASTFKITNALMDNLEDVWDTRPIDSLIPAGSVMADNVLEANVHAKTHHGVLVRPHRDDTDAKVMIKSRVDVNIWCQDGVGAITQSDGTTDEFGASVAYRFCDMKSSPIKEITGFSAANAKPQWSFAPNGGSVHLGNKAANNHISATESTTSDGGTKILDITSPQVQVITGSTTHTLRLPSTGVKAGQAYVVINQGSSTVSIQSSGTGAIITQFPSKIIVLTAVVDAPTAATDWQITGMAASSSASTQTLAMRDTNGNILADAFIATATSTATAAGTTTLTINSAQVQVFTGSTTQTVLLPTTGVVAGQSYTVVNNSSSTLAVQSSNTNAIITQFPSKAIVYTALINAPVASTDWQITGLAATTATGAQTVAMRDTNGNLTADTFIATASSTTTAAGTTALSINSAQTQVFTGTTTQTVTLPTTSIVAGQWYTIINNSSGTVTVQSSGGDPVKSLTSGESALCLALSAAPTSAAHWRPI